MHYIIPDWNKNMDKVNKNGKYYKLQAIRNLHYPTVQTPLGFFVLVVLIVEVILGTTTATLSEGFDRTILIVGMIALISYW